MTTRLLTRAVALAVALIVAAAHAASASITVPAGWRAVLSNTVLAGCDANAYGYVLGSSGNVRIGAKVNDCPGGTINPEPDATIGPVSSAQTLLIYLQDTTCNGTYYSDGTGNANHALVTGPGPYTVQLNDAGPSCSVLNTSDVPSSGDNFHTTVTLIAPPAPSAVTGNASNLLATAATLNGTVNPNGGIVSDCHFDWGTSTAYGQSAPCSQTVGPGTSGVSVSAQLTGLAPHTTYHVRIIASNLAGPGPGTGSDQTFSTPASSKPLANTGAPSVESSTTAGFSGSVNPEGSSTSAYFQYGLDPSYNGGGPLVYTNQLAASPSPLGSDFSSHAASARATGLVPNALYHVRLVASNGNGTTFGPDLTFRTRSDPAPSSPVLGRSVDMTPVSGHVYIKPPGAGSVQLSAATGPGFVPLTEARNVPTGSQIDSRYGKFKLNSASGKKGKLSYGTFGGAIVSVSQVKSGRDKGLTTFKLLLGAFPGAPSLKSCSTKAANEGGPVAEIASLSSAYHASSHGRFRTRSGRSVGSHTGTQWDTINRCNGVLYKVFRGTVVVNDGARHKIVVVHAGHSYLAKR